MYIYYEATREQGFTNFQVWPSAHINELDAYLDSDHATADCAAARVAYLNGGGATQLVDGPCADCQSGDSGVKPVHVIRIEPTPESLPEPEMPY